uniref:Uncharacterized protein n=1 Tax=Oryza brachyantha TaxID=4533 RepID=J3N9F8_ORYBR
MAELPKMHRGQEMDHFVAGLSRMVFTTGYPYDPEYTAVHRLSGEFPHRVRLELHRIPNYLPNLEVVAPGGTHEHACQEAAYSMMAAVRDRHDPDLRHTAYRYHPDYGPNDMVSSFRSAETEQDTTFGRMCTVLQGLDRMYHDLHEAAKELNDCKIMKIDRLQNQPLLTYLSPQFGVVLSSHAAGNANEAGVTNWVTVSSSLPSAGILKEVKIENSRSRSEDGDEEGEPAVNSGGHRSSSEQ